jgi:pimeloyl-ACP methyl ester carboxylesterase
MTLRIEHADHVATRLGSLYVRTVGSGRPAVLWPSMFVDSHTWDRMLPLLQRESAIPRRFALIDPPGLGNSEPLRTSSTIAGAAAAARDALAHLDLGGPVDWVGNAFGGHVGYELADVPLSFAVWFPSAPRPSRSTGACAPKSVPSSRFCALSAPLDRCATR